MKKQQIIDFVVPWVDSNDPIWQQDYIRHSNRLDLQKNPRYRDWDIFHYWFRGIEKYAPWVNKVHFITYGHIPKWLNTNHPKLNIVKHTDYINNKYLPTFNSHAIELNMHRIKGLSNNFVYFNDDMFLINPIKESFYFINNIPRDACIFNAITGASIFDRYLLNNSIIINKNFSKSNFIKKNILKVFNVKYKSLLIKNLLLIPWPKFTGFENFHLPQPFNKKTFEDVWFIEKEVLEKTTKNKFRSPEDVNQYIFKIWQLLSGNFIPTNIQNHGINISPTLINLPQIEKIFEKNTVKNICLNDSEEIEDFEKSKKFIKAIFLKKFPKKSSYEK